MGRDMLAVRRRSALALLGLALIAIVPLTSATAHRVRASKGRMRVSFFADGLIVDPSGTLPIYRAPDGYRGGDAWSALTDEHWRRLHPFC